MSGLKVDASMHRSIANAWSESRYITAQKYCKCLGLKVDTSLHRSIANVWSESRYINIQKYCKCLGLKVNTSMSGSERTLTNYRKWQFLSFSFAECFYCFKQILVRQLTDKFDKTISENVVNLIKMSPKRVPKWQIWAISLSKIC